MRPPSGGVRQGTETASRLLVNHLRPELLPAGTFRRLIAGRPERRGGTADSVAFRPADQFTEPWRPEQ